MKIKNAAWVDPAPNYTPTQKTALQTFLTASGVQFLDFEVLRAMYPAAQRAALTDGVLAQICQDLGLKVEP